MRTNYLIEQTEVVALVMEDAASVITATCSSVKEVIERKQMGWTKKVTKDFLSPNSTNNRICRGVNATKRKCSAIKLSVLPDNLKSEIEGSELFSKLFFLHFIIVIQSHVQIATGLKLKSQMSTMVMTAPS